MIIGDSYDSHTLSHIGTLENNLDDIISKITECKPKLEQKVKLLSSLMLSNEEMQTFASLAVPLKFPEHLEVDYNQLLVPQRAKSI